MKKFLLIFNLLFVFLFGLVGCSEQTTDEGKVLFSIEDAKLKTSKGYDYVVAVKIYTTSGSSNGVYYATELIQYNNYFTIKGYDTASSTYFYELTYSNNCFGYYYEFKTHDIWYV